MSHQKPNFLVVGAARSGTTGLVEGLRSHPQVFVTTPKEPHYFALHRIGAHFTAPGDAHTVNKVAVTDRDAYLSLYPQDHDYLALGDASVSTMYYFEDALPEIRAMNPEMKLVVLLREPVERAFSSHQYLRARGLEPTEDFLEAVAAEEERKAAGYHHLWHYTSMSHYGPQLAAIYEQFPREQVGVWFYDDLNADYVGTVGSILRFLGVPPVAGEAAGVPRVNVSGQPRGKAVKKAFWFAVRDERVRNLVKRLTTYRFRERVRRLTLRSSALPPGAREQLAPRFQEDLRVVRELVSGPVPAWLAAEGQRR